MHRLVIAALIVPAVAGGLAAHGVGSTPITWNREISRLVYDKCASCHRPEGVAFSLLTYLDVQPRANEIKDAVLSRRMPPWGAVKGFASFRNDQSLMQEQIELIARWVDGGVRRGNNPLVLPQPPGVPPAAEPVSLIGALRVSGLATLDKSLTLDGLFPERVPAGRSLRVVAVLPNGRSEPLVWLHDYDERVAHPFLFRKALHLPAGTIITGVPPDVTLVLIPSKS
jgi:mono/diheme cytochrome c family protein